MVMMKQQQSPASAHSSLPSLGHSASPHPPPSPHSLSPSPSSSKRLRLNHGGSFNYGAANSQAHPAFAASPPSSSSSASPSLTYSFDPSQMPASLAPSSIHRQHSSGTGQVLESSLFDLPSGGAWIPQAYPLQHSDSLSSPSFPSHSSSASPPSASDEEYAQHSAAVTGGGGGGVARKHSLATPTFAPHGQPGFDSLSPSVSSPPHHLPALASSPLLQVYGDFSFSHPSHHYDDLSAPALPPYGRDQSFIAFPLSASQELNGGMEGSSYDYASPSHAQQLPIGSLNRMSSEDAQLSAAAAAESAGQRAALDFATVPSSSASSHSSAAHPLAHYPHIVPPSHKAASSSLPSSPASTPPSTPKSPHLHAQTSAAAAVARSSKKRHRRSSGDEDGDEKASVSSGNSAHSHSSSSKDRHVNTAVKLVTSNDESGEFLMDTKVKQIFYPRPDWPKPHRIRLIEVEDLKSGRRSVYAHGADVGSVVERKSNISRLFGKFTSPNEKLLMNVPGPHNHTVGQESNILTEMGIRRFLDTNKMKGQEHYRQWILQHLIPRLRNGEHQANEHQQMQLQQHPGLQLQQPQPHLPLIKREQQPQSHALVHSLAAPTPHRVSVGAAGYSGATDSPQSLPSSPQSYSSSYSSDSYHSSH